MDFSQLGNVSVGRKIVDPISIFESLPNLPGTPNDIWRGQTDALEKWHENRKINDVLIELNTGAGKTLVGILIAQSLVNEGLQNVVYVCATKDLVNQTSAEANKIGIAHSLRIGGGYNNDLFQSGKAFCITTYHALFNGLSSIRRYNFPEAIIFDDAHVSEQTLRGALTLAFNGESHPKMFKSVVELFEDHFKDLDRHGEYLHAVDPSYAKVVMSAPGAVQKKKNQLLEILKRHGIEQDDDLKYPFNHLKDRLDRCSVLFGYGRCEITPPFLPSLALDCLERPIRRVYLSATLKHKTDFVRSYGRLPDVTIGPRNDAGNGERLIILGRDTDADIDVGLVKDISKQHKVLIAVPSYGAANEWRDVAIPPKPEDFSVRLDQFRKASSGVFVLVQRVDGIDLPHETCRVMVIDGLPSGASLLEKFQWEYLSMKNFFASKVANRLAQLFGRINRGRNDYGVFIIASRELHTWISNDRNVSLLPELLQQQIKLGIAVQKGMAINDKAKIIEVTSSVIARNPSWLSFYGDNIQKSTMDSDDCERADEIEKRMTDAALAEARYAKHSWDGDYSGACRELEIVIEETLRADTPLAGWHNIWLGAAYEKAGDLASAAKSYEHAKSRLGNNIYLTRYHDVGDVVDVPLNGFGQNINYLVGPSSEDVFRKERRKLESSLQYLNGGSPRQAEASVRELGELLGFHATRPDNDVGTGPDVLWVDEEGRTALLFELKTDKLETSLISKKDVGQGHQHNEWVAENYPEFTNIGLVFVSDVIRCDKTASPSDNMYVHPLQDFRSLKDEIFSLIDDLRNHMPIERLSEIRDCSAAERWTLVELGERLSSKQLKALSA
jgi:hypothetical protein